MSDLHSIDEQLSQRVREIISLTKTCIPVLSEFPDSQEKLVQVCRKSAHSTLFLKELLAKGDASKIAVQLALKDLDTALREMVAEVARSAIGQLEPRVLPALEQSASDIASMAAQLKAAYDQLCGPHNFPQPGSPGGVGVSSAATSPGGPVVGPVVHQATPISLSGSLAGSQPRIPSLSTLNLGVAPSELTLSRSAPAVPIGAPTRPVATEKTAVPSLASMRRLADMGVSANGTGRLMVRSGSGPNSAWATTPLGVSPAPRRRSAVEADIAKATAGLPISRELSADDQYEDDASAVIDFIEGELAREFGRDLPPCNLQQVTDDLQSCAPWILDRLRNEVANNKENSAKHRQLQHEHQELKDAFERWKQRAAKLFSEKLKEKERIIESLSNRPDEQSRDKELEEKTNEIQRLTRVSADIEQQWRKAKQETAGYIQEVEEWKKQVSESCKRQIHGKEKEIQSLRQRLAEEKRRAEELAARLAGTVLPAGGAASASASGRRLSASSATSDSSTSLASSAASAARDAASPTDSASGLVASGGQGLVAGALRQSLETPADMLPESPAPPAPVPVQASTSIDAMPLPSGPAMTRSGSGSSLPEYVVAMAAAAEHKASADKSRSPPHGLAGPPKYGPLRVNMPSGVSFASVEIQDGMLLQTVLSTVCSRRGITDPENYDFYHVKARDGGLIPLTTSATQLTVREIKLVRKPSAPPMPNKPDFSEMGIGDVSETDFDLFKLMDDPKAHEEAVPEPLVCPAPSFEIEHGSSRVKLDEGASRRLIEVEKYTPFFKLYFSAKGHVIYVAESGCKAGPVIVTLESESERREAYAPDQVKLRALVRSKYEDEWVTIKDNAKSRSKALIKAFETCKIADKLAGVKLRKIEAKPAETSRVLDDMESKLMPRGYKIGVLYCREGQTDEDHMFSNGSPDDPPSAAYDEFLNFLGPRVKLQGFPHYRAGLDVKNDTTGTESVWFNHLGYEIMLHVSTLLPYHPKDPQKIERKRHLGNDVCIIVFKDSPDPLFNPSWIKSEFNHVFAVVCPVRGAGPTQYRVSFAYKDGTQFAPPFLPFPAVFEQNEAFRELLFTKLINAERKAMYAPGFERKIARTKELQVQNAVAQLLKLDS